MLGLALFVGASSFLTGLVVLFALLDIPDDDPRQRLFDLNVAIGVAVVTLSLGGMLVYQAASALGNQGSSAQRWPARWGLWAAGMTALFVALIGIGQLQVNNPERLPWLFAFTNVGIVSIPSAVIAAVVAKRYARYNPFAWPVSWREWTSGFIYGAIGATSIAGLINSLYLGLMGAFLIGLYGEGDAWDLGNGLPTLPTNLGIAFDLSVLSVVAPLNEEFWKGMLVAFFFFRKGGAARCFLWGVLAGAGFNLFETFGNSLSVVNPEQVSEQTLSDDWWLFATARAGTSALHSAAAGLAALGFHGLFRSQPRYLIGYPLGVLFHASWNFLTYVLSGDAIFSQAGPDSRMLDVVAVSGMVALFAACLAVLWELPRRLRDASPAPIYALLGMVPANAPGVADDSERWPRGRGVPAPGPIPGS